MANPARSAHETTLDGNAARVRIRLQGDTVELVGQGEDVDDGDGLRAALAGAGVDAGGASEL